MCNLRFLEIHIGLGAATGGDFAVLASLMGLLPISLTSPATLERLRFNIRVCALNHNFYENLRKTWSHLDSIATHPNGSRLQRVDINIKAFFPDKYHDCSGCTWEEREKINEDEVLKVAFEALPLLHTKGIVFVKAAMAGDYEYIEVSVWE